MASTQQPTNQLLDNKKRQEIESLVYKVMDTIDKTGTNSEYYKNLFADMDNNQFYHFLERRLPFRFHQEIFKIEPKMYEIIDAFKVLNKPLFEKVKLPYLYKDEKGTPVETKECLVIYLHIKRMKQMLTKKNAVAINIDQRDMKTGRLLNQDKGGQESDREFETLAITDLQNTIDEFSRIKADSMKSKNEVYNIIKTQGSVSMEDVEIEKSDSLSKNFLNVYLLGAHIMSNIVNEDYLTPYTLKNKRKQIERI